MPTVDSQPPRGFRLLTIFLIAILLASLCYVGYRHVSPVKTNGLISDSTSNTPSANSGISLAPFTNVAAVPKPAAPGTAVSADSVLAKIDEWTAEHPNSHSRLETAFPNGSVVGKMDVYTYSNNADGTVVKLKAEMFAPAMKFQAVKQNGKLRVYFPQSDQLVEPDMTKMLVDMPTLVGTTSGARALLKLSQSSFAEASGDLQVVTLVISAEKLKVPQSTGLVYLSLRANSEGKLLGIEEQAQGQRIITSMNYLSFDRTAIMHDAPVLPAGKTVVTNKTLVQAMQEEVGMVISKPLRKI